MKAKRPNTDQEVEFVAYANGKPCTEYVQYVLPFDKSNADIDTLTCFIPVNAGDQLTIVGSFSGSILKGTFDLLADGSFVAQKRIEPMKDEEGNNTVKYHTKRSLKLEKVLNVSTEPGRTTTLPSDSVSEGNLHVKTTEGHHGSGRSILESRVGSLTVVCSLAQNDEDTYTHSYNSCTCGSLAQRVSELARKDGSGIPPEYELEFKTTNDAVSKSRANKHKQHYREPKCGSRPWATFVFHYRSKTAIEEADCELWHKKSTELEPADAESFIKGSTDTAKKRKRVKSRTEHDETNSVMGEGHSAFMTPPSPDQNGVESFAEPSQPTVAPTTDQPWESNEVAEPRTPASTSSNPLFLTPPPLSKKKKKSDGGVGKESAADPPLFERMSTAREAAPSTTSPKPLSFASFNREARMKEEADERSREQSLDPLYIMTDEEIAQTTAAAETFLSSTLRAQAEPVDAQGALPPLDGSCIDSETETIDVASAAAAKHVKREQTPPRSVRTGNDEQSFHQRTAQQRPSNTAAELVDNSNIAARGGFRQQSPAYPGIEKAKNAMTSPLLTSHSYSPERSPAHSTRSSQGTTATGCLLAPSDIAEFIPPEGIKLKDLEDHFTEEDLPNTLQAKRHFVQLVRGVAHNVKDLYFLKASSQVTKAHLNDSNQQSQQKSTSQFDVNQASFHEVKASTLEPDDNLRAQEEVDETAAAPKEVNPLNQKATSEPLQPSQVSGSLPQQTPGQQRPHSGPQTSAKLMSEKIPASSQRTPISQATSSPTYYPQSLPRNSPATATADTISPRPRPGLTPELPDRLTGSLKRSASIMTASRESTPSSKKSKFEELSTRKLALQKSLSEKKAKRVEARRAFEELQKHRELEEQRRIEAEEREIAMLERMAAEEEEEYTGLVEATEAEEAAIAEAKLARERAEEAVRLSKGA
ncbi:hypothetical protein KC343_g6039 [Hortaea werneckii]|nr:hypothetical protein KC338_g2851 [Hortaea werneckii]KAI7250170.1 hypothetical protein KC352_g12917 [Hortaea werneckii]KAI7355199.1 hypothetical protein KC320_g2961 [Hortaea werneckii]KAI7563228.1 hypothetical protein KC317_g7872 [Hortaea werneckii]KAI7611272.1 hypothetical protein KC346_g8372 [Hortaea werneckii]